MSLERKTCVLEDTCPFGSKPPKLEGFVPKEIENEAILMFEKFWDIFPNFRKFFPNSTTFSPNFRKLGIFREFEIF